MNPYNFISFNSASRVVYYYSTNDDYGDTTYAVTIIGTDPSDGSYTASLSFNIVVKKPCYNTAQEAEPTASDSSWSAIQFVNAESSGFRVPSTSVGNEAWRCADFNLASDTPATPYQCESWTDSASSAPFPCW